MILRSQTKEFQSKLTLCNLFKSSSITVKPDIFNDDTRFANIYPYLPNEVTESLKRTLIDYFQEYYELILQYLERFANNSNDIYTVWNKMKSIHKKKDNESGISIPDIPISFNHEEENSTGTSNYNSTTMENEKENENETLTDHENDNIIINDTFNPPNEYLKLNHTQDTFKDQLWPFSIDELMDTSRLPDLYSDDLLYESLHYDSVMDINDMLD